MGSGSRDPGRFGAQTWRLRGPNEPEPEPVTFTEIPACPGPDRVLVASRYAGLCETDAKIWAGVSAAPWVRYPVILGHEWIAQVVRDPTGRLNSGTWVVVEGLIPCRRCRSCNRGQSNRCVAPEHSGMSFDGGFAPLAWVPERALYPVNPGPHPEAYVLVEPAASVLRAVEAVSALRPASVLVLGAGSVGLLASAQLQDLLPHARVWVYDPVAPRSAMASRFSATAVPGVKPEMAEAVVECSGSARAVSDAIRAARPGGVIALEGVSRPDETISLAPWTFHAKELTLVGVYSATVRSFQASLEWVTARAEDLAFLLEGPYAARELPRLIRRLGNPERRGKMYVAWPPLDQGAGEED